ncbi:MAG: bifunctional nuclease family protein [Bacteroidetes bacterium]|nr:bifunctional nuclease family protein [Bacteroidota bacterium]
MSRIKLNVLGLSPGTSSGSYTLILGESNGTRRLPIVIGSSEAQAIAIEIEKIVPFRPMTHDLFLSFCKQFEIQIIEIIIYNLHEGVFHAKLICEQHGEMRELDARTSDSIALAVRFKCPIYTYEDIMEQAGIEVNDESPNMPDLEDNDDDDEPIVDVKKNITSMSIEELNKQLEDALKVEDYALAARIRDEINNKKKT